MTTIPKYKTEAAKRKLIKEYHDSGKTLQHFATQRGIHPTTLGRYLKLFKKDTNRATTTYNNTPMEIRHKILKEHLVHSIPFAELSGKHKIPIATMAYWRDRWREGKMKIPGLPVTPQLLNTFTRVKAPAPLQFDAKSLIEIEKLKAEIKYLKTLLNENNIEWELNKNTGKARDNYLMDVIQANGIEIGLLGENTDV